jgi:hypothetical protein
MAVDVGEWREVAWFLHFQPELDGAYARPSLSRWATSEHIDPAACRAGCCLPHERVFV